MKTFRRLAILAMVAICATAAWAQEDDSKYMVRFRLIGVSPDESSSEILDTGSFVAVDDAVVPEVDLTVFFNNNWALEVIAATAEHDMSAAGGALTGADLGSVWLLPPTFTLQYHFGKGGPVDVYVGAGVNYTLFYSYDLSDDLAGLGVSDIDFDNSFGLALQLGADFRINPSWTFNLDIKRIDLSTDATLELAGGGSLTTIAVDIDPFVYGVGVGYRF